jgi:hypothetical protein
MERPADPWPANARLLSFLRNHRILMLYLGTPDAGLPEAVVPRILELAPREGFGLMWLAAPGTLKIGTVLATNRLIYSIR